MKILYLVSSPDFTLNMKGGGGTHIRGTIKGMQENGHEIFPLIIGDQLTSKAPTKQPIQEKNFLRDKLKKITPSKLRLVLRDLRYYYQSRNYSKKFISQVRSFNPDIIYERSCLFSTTGIQIAKEIKKPLYLETSGCLPEIFKETYGLSSLKLANRLERWKLKNADVVVTEAESAVQYVGQKFKLKNKKIIPKPLGVEFNTENLESKIQDTLTIGYVGTFATYHRVELLLPVFEYFRNSSVKFILIGAGGNSSLIQDEVINRNLNNVEFTGYLNKGELLNVYSKIDIGIVPNCEHHMAPIKTFEYGVYGICPMVPDFHAFKKLIQEDSNGILFSPYSSESIIKKIQKILSNNVDVSLYARNWNQFVRNNYQWQEVVKGVLTHAEENKKKNHA